MLSRNYMFSYIIFDNIKYIYFDNIKFAVLVIILFNFDVIIDCLDHVCRHTFLSLYIASTFAVLVTLFDVIIGCFFCLWICLSRHGMQQVPKHLKAKILQVLHEW